MDTLRGAALAFSLFITLLLMFSTALISHAAGPFALPHQIGTSIKYEVFSYGQSTGLHMKLVLKDKRPASFTADGEIVDYEAPVFDLYSVYAGHETLESSDVTYYVPTCYLYPTDAEFYDYLEDYLELGGATVTRSGNILEWTKSAAGITTTVKIDMSYGVMTYLKQCSDGSEVARWELREAPGWSPGGVGGGGEGMSWVFIGIGICAAVAVGIALFFMKFRT